jgi:hypothetical protein
MFFCLERIQFAVCVDYAGMEFGLNTIGELLVFEGNASAVVHPPGEGENCARRLPARQRIHAALQQMLKERAGFPRPRSVGPNE